MREGEGRRTEAQELLEEAFEVCMDEDLSFIPPENEIARMHTFSEDFLEKMKVLLRTKGKPEKRQISRREFVYGFNRTAACILAVLLVCGACAGGLILVSRSAGSKSAPMDGLEPGTAENSMDTAAEAAEPQEAPEEEEAVLEEEVETGLEDTAAGAEDGGKRPSEYADFMGSRIGLAGIQELPEKSEKVKTLVNSPLIARDAEDIKITIGNMGEYPIYYYTDMDIEVLIDGAWYTVPPREEPSEEERERMVYLEPGMAQDEEILLEEYDWDYDAQRYRVVTYLEGMILCSEFRFENLEEDLEEVLDAKEDLD